MPNKSQLEEVKINLLECRKLNLSTIDKLEDIKSKTKDPATLAMLNKALKQAKAFNKNLSVID